MSSQAIHRPQNPTPPAQRTQLRLRVFGGLHAGAEFRLPERGILMVGNADDCDLILADADIHEHHCVLTMVGDQVLLRALNGHVAVGDKPVASGENITLEHFALVSLGSAQFAVGPHWSERWLSMDEAAGHGDAALVQKQLAQRRRGVLAIVGLLLALAIFVLLGSWKVSHPSTVQPRSASNQLEAARAILHQMSLRHVTADVDSSNRLVVHGVVGNAAQLPELRQKLSQAGLSTELTVRDWPSVAKQVTDIFGMHGYTVETQLLDQGVIEVDGHFGDQDNAEKVKREVLGSSDMQQLNGAVGLNLALRNFDEHKQEPPKLDDGKRIVHVNSGDDTYVVTRDQSRYYPGSALPQGGTLVGVTEQETILIRMTDGSYMQLDKADKYATPRALGDIDSIDLAHLTSPASASSAPAAATSAAATGTAKETSAPRHR